MNRIHRTAASLAGLLAVLLLGGCGGSSVSALVPVATATDFPAGSSMERISEQKRVKIGVKFDQPGLSFRKPGTAAPTGFDIEIAKIVAAKLGVAPADIEWIETVTKNREPFLQNGTVDLVVATYSITDSRRSVVSQAGPYYSTGQQLLVRADSPITGPDDLPGQRVCSVTGATSIKTVRERYGATPAPFATYSECVTQLLNGSVDAVTTDGAILLGYAAEDPDRLKVVGPPFSTERYSIGFAKGDQQMCDFLKKTITDMYADGSWRAAFEQTLGASGAPTPEPPPLDETCSAP